MKQRPRNGHAIDFGTARSLAREQELADEQVIEVMTAMIRCLAAGGSVRPGVP